MNGGMKIGFIGCGKMASAIVRGIVHAGVVAGENIIVSDPASTAANELAHELGISVAKDNSEVCLGAETIILCVKPNDAIDALRALQSELAGKLLISIVSGLTISTLQAAAGSGVRIVRVMPNTPALIQKGASAYSAGPEITEVDTASVEKLLGAVGYVCRVKENLLDAVTGLSGSGPAYVYLAIEALADGGVLMGLPRELSLRLAAQTVAGSAEMVLQTGQHPAVLRDMVASPGGTTIAAIEVLEAKGARSAFIAAVRTAAERAFELGASK